MTDQQSGTPGEGNVPTPKTSAWGRAYKFCRRVAPVFAIAAAILLALNFAWAIFGHFAGTSQKIEKTESNLSLSILELKKELSDSVNNSATGILEKVNENTNKLGILEERSSHIKEDVISLRENLGEVEQKIDKLQQSSNQELDIPLQVFVTPR